MCVGREEAALGCVFTRALSAQATRVYHTCDTSMSTAVIEPAISVLEEGPLCQRTHHDSQHVVCIHIMQNRTYGYYVKQK